MERCSSLLSLLSLLPISFSATQELAPASLATMTDESLARPAVWLEHRGPRLAPEARPTKRSRPDPFAESLEAVERTPEEAEAFRYLMEGWISGDQRCPNCGAGTTLWRYAFMARDIPKAETWGSKGSSSDSRTACRCPSCGHTWSY